MSEHVFYSTENNHNHRELTIVNVAQLVGKAPTKDKRIRIKVRMILSDQTTTGEPDWISAAHTYVATWHDPISPVVDFKGYDLHFSAENLFDAEGVKSPRCQMRSFEIHECGESENPDVAATFTIYTPFSGPLWNWLGQFGGESCWCAFTPGVPGTTEPTGTDQPALTSGEPDEQEGDEEEEGDEEAQEIDAETETAEDTSDVLMTDALHVFQNHGKVSALELQRVLSISYVKAAHVIDSMEEKGMVSKADDNGQRALLVSVEKSGPKDLAAYHDKVVEGEVKRGRGRPRKNPVDPLTVDVATAF